MARPVGLSAKEPKAYPFHPPHGNDEAIKKYIGKWLDALTSSQLKEVVKAIKGDAEGEGLGDCTQIQGMKLTGPRRPIRAGDILVGSFDGSGYTCNHSPLPHPDDSGDVILCASCWRKYKAGAQIEDEDSGRELLPLAPEEVKRPKNGVNSEFRIARGIMPGGRR